MDNCAVSSSYPYDVLIYSGRRRDAVAHSSIRSSFDQQPSFATTRNSKKGLRTLRFRPPPIKEVKSFQSKPPRSIPDSNRSSQASAATHSAQDRGAADDADAGTYANTDTEGTWTAASTLESQRGFIDLEAGCGTWPEQIRPVPFWRRARGRLFRSKVESKIRHPESCRDVSYQVRPKFHLLKFVLWIGLFFLYQLVLRIVLDEGMCSSPDWHTGNGEVLDSIVTWGSAILAGSAAFLIGQGYFGLRATRERMERVRQTAATLAYAFIKAMSVPGGGHSQGELPLTVYECLALLTAYPVALLHQVQGNTCEPAVTKYCQQVAYKLKEFHDGIRTFTTSPCAGRQDVPLHHHGPKQHVRMEYFFELLSLHLEKEFSQQWRQEEIPSMTPQHIIYNLRNHFENIVDNHYLDPGRAPIVRENIDMLALAGRECTVYGGSDVIPLCMLWTIDICSRGIAFAVPIRHCSWFTSTSGLPLVWRMAVLAVVSAIVILLLNEMWSLWDPFGRGVNTFSWTLGIASEIDNMINEFYESENKVPVREHKFMDSGEYLSSSSSSSSGTTRTTTTTGTGTTAPSEDMDARQRRR